MTSNVLRKGGDAASALSLTDLDYQLPSELIAQTPLDRRDQARLLVVDRSAESLTDAGVGDLPDLLRKDDLLILNNTRVVPARFTARRATGGRLSGLFLAEEAPSQWVVMLERSRRLRVGEVLTIKEHDSDRSISMRPEAPLGEGRWRVVVDSTRSASETLERIGETPLPPYIDRPSGNVIGDQIDRARYQTIYASVPGAVAAPTAGLHFTNELLERLAVGGIKSAFVTLHVGLGTFKPVSAEDLSQHVMHEEHYVLPVETAQAVYECRRRGGRVIAVGTTSVRVLESAIDQEQVSEHGVLFRPGPGSTRLFIFPPYRFCAVDGLLTNFHLPRSTLLALVMAFAGIELTRRAYDHAIRNRYRFYSYGDAMLIL